MPKLIFCIFLNIVLFSFPVFSKNVIEVISENKNLTTFYSYLKETGLDKILEKKLPFNWTIFAPSNNAFKNASSRLKSDVLGDDFYSKNIFMDHIMTGHTTSLDVNEEISTQITVSNKPLQIYKSKKLHVKDMVVIQENLMANNGVIHMIDCIMYVQPSADDKRVPDDLAKNFPITSCCMQSEKEIKSFMESVESRF